MKRVLIANIFGIGDVLFTAPLVSGLKKAMPSVSIDYLCNARTAEVVRRIPGVEKIFVYEKDDFVKLWNASKTRFFSEILSLFNSIRRKRYDAVFDLTMSRKFSFFFMLVGIRERVGLSYKGRGVFLTKKKKFDGFSGRHVIEFYLDLLGLAGVRRSGFPPEILLGEEEKRRASEYLKKTAAGKKIVAVMPGGGASWGKNAPRKRWSAVSFAKAADILSDKGIAVALVGGSAERELCDQVVRDMKNKPAFVETDLELQDFMALLGECDLTLCNDGGPLHVAVALGVPTVSIFGPVDEKVYGPYSPSERHRVFTAKRLACRPCYSRFKLPECRFDNRCLTEIKPEEVAEACLEILRHGNG